MSKSILDRFDGSSIEGLTALIDRLEQSSFDYLKLEANGVKLVIGKNGVCDGTEAAPAMAAAPLPAAPVKAPVPAVPAAEPYKPAGPIAEEAGLFIVKSPSYGIFYAQSEPGAPAYVALGDTVEKGDTLGLLEIMKTFNAVSSEVDGEVVAIHVQNQDVLEPGQALFSIRVK